MNNRERAERIWDDLSGRAGCGIDSWEPAIRSECLDMIIAQLDEAVKEALVAHYEGEDSPVAKIKFEAYAKGYAVAREEAAGIVMETSLDSGDPFHVLAERVRAMAPAAGEAGK